MMSSSLKIIITTTNFRKKINYFCYYNICSCVLYSLVQEFVNKYISVCQEHKLVGCPKALDLETRYEFASHPQV